MQNRAGDDVDPVPWLVVAGLGFMVLFAFGPIYLQGYGLAIEAAIATTGALYVGLVAASYWRYVYTANPALRAEVPVEDRLRRLFYAILAGILLLGAISIPLATQ